MFTFKSSSIEEEGPERTDDGPTDKEMEDMAAIIAERILQVSAQKNNYLSRLTCLSKPTFPTHYLPPLPYLCRNLKFSANCPKDIFSASAMLFETFVDNNFSLKFRQDFTLVLVHENEF